MAYDPGMDKVGFSETIDGSNDSKIVVATYSYNGGTAKLQISRINLKEGEEQFAKLGRLTVDEVKKVLPVVQKALKYMEGGK